MVREDRLHDAIGSIYDAALDTSLWPAALIKLSDAMETAHVGFCAMDRRTKLYDAIAPRTDPTWDALY